MSILQNYILKKRNKNRLSKFNYFVSKFMLDEKVSILDVGPDDDIKTSFTNILEELHPYPHNITALGIGQLCQFKKHYPKINVVTYAGRRFPFKDQAFDLIWSNAVLEHIGDNDKQVQFIKEIRRCGRNAFITTPNYFFPIEIHTQTLLLHLILPKAIFDLYLKIIGKTWATGNYMNLLSYKKIKEIMYKCDIREYKIYSKKIGPFTHEFWLIF
jgi:SAM-dependent methyltransferase